MMKQLLQFLFIFMLATHNLFGSSQSSPEIIIKQIVNQTPFTLQFGDRYTHPPTVIELSPDSVTEYKHAIGNNDDIAIENLSSNDMYAKNNFFCNRARFKIAVLDSDGRRKEGKSNYAHLGIKSDKKDVTDTAIVFRHGHLHTNTHYYRGLDVSRCQNCNLNGAEKAGCRDCTKAFQNFILSKQVAVDIIFGMHQREIENDTGRLSFGCRTRRNKN